MSKPFASQADLQEKKATFSKLASGDYAYTTEGDPNTGIIVGPDGVMVIDARATPVLARELMDVIRTVTHESVTKEELGGAMTHNEKSGVAHFALESDHECLRLIRELLSFMPSNNLDDPPRGELTDPVDREDPALETVVPAYLGRLRPPLARAARADLPGLPAPLAATLPPLDAGVHHHLVRTKTRTMVGLLIEAGDVREVHHVALLIGYGAAAVNPYLAFETIDDMMDVMEAHKVGDQVTLEILRANKRQQLSLTLQAVN